MSKKLNKWTAWLHTLPFMTWATLFFFFLITLTDTVKSFLDDLEMCMDESNSCHSPFATTSWNVVQEWGKGSSQFTHVQKRLAENQCNRLKDLVCWPCYPYAGLCASLIVPTCFTSLFQQLLSHQSAPRFYTGKCYKGSKKSRPSICCQIVKADEKAQKSSIG